MHPSLVIHNPIVIQPQRLCLHFLIFLEEVAFLRFFDLVVHQPCNAETDTCLQPYDPFHFLLELALVLIPTFTRPSRASTHQKNIYMVLEEWTHVYFCLRYFSSSTHFYLVKGAGSEGVAVVCSGFSHDLETFSQLQRQ